MGVIDDKYEAKFARSRQWYERGQNAFAGGVTHQSRFTAPYPTYYESASGPFKYDVDGNEIIDYVMGNGSLLLGHSPEGVVDAVRKQIDRVNASGRRDHPRDALRRGGQAQHAQARDRALHVGGHRINPAGDEDRTGLFGQGEDNQVLRALPRLAGLRDDRLWPVDWRGAPGRSG